MACINTCDNCCSYTLVVIFRILITDSNIKIPVKMMSENSVIGDTENCHQILHHRHRGIQQTVEGFDLKQNLSF